MQEAYVKILNIPTHIITWGKSLDDSLKDVKEIIICITGNPGLPSFYIEFLDELYTNMKGELPIWIIGHTGHDDPPETHPLQVPPLAGNQQSFGLDSQIDHKVEFVKRFLPKHVKIHFIGHSIGSWMILQMLKLQFIKDQTQKCYMLFPTIERMVQSPNGKFFTTTILPLYRFFGFLITLFYMCPNFIRIILIQLYFWICSIPTTFVDTVMRLTKPSVIQKILHLASEEMKFVNQLDIKLIEANTNLIKLYYSTNDGWVPVQYYNEIKKDVHNIDATLDTQNIEHAFVLRSSKEMANILCNWITENRIQ